MNLLAGILCLLSWPGRASARGMSDEEMLAGLLDALIPSGETPGARDVGLHSKMLAMLGRDREKKDIYTKGLDEVRLAIAGKKGPLDWNEVAMSIERTRFFAHLRRDAMRMFYSEPASWRAIGYPGHPLAGYSDYNVCDKDRAAR